MCRQGRQHNKVHSAFGQRRSRHSRLRPLQPLRACREDWKPCCSGAESPIPEGALEQTSCRLAVSTGHLRDFTTFANQLTG